MQPVFKGVLYPSIVHSISNLTIVERTRHGLPTLGLGPSRVG